MAGSVRRPKWLTPHLLRRLRSGALLFALISGFAALSYFGGDALWETVVAATPPPALPSAALAATPAPTAGADLLGVWVSKSGTRYHKTDTCGGMQAARALSLSDAQIEGYTACQRCQPPE